MVEAIARQYSSRVGGNQMKNFKERNLKQDLKQQVEKRMLMSEKLTPRNPFKKSSRYDNKKIQEVYTRMYPNSADMILNQDQLKAYLGDHNRQKIISNIKNIYQQLQKPPSTRSVPISSVLLPVFP